MTTWSLLFLNTSVLNMTVSPKMEFWNMSNGAVQNSTLAEKIRFRQCLDLF